MVTDDPDTPGDGRWEINLGNIGTRTGNGWLIQALDADVNYGWGDRVQLRVESPWNVGQHGSTWSSGAGTTLLGVKWRFFESGIAKERDEKEAAKAGSSGAPEAPLAHEAREHEAPQADGSESMEWTVSTYPQLGVNLAPYSASHGLVTPGHSIFLPLESAVHLGPLDLDFELGRNFVQQGADSWVAGVILAHAFTPRWECMFETRARFSAQETATLLNFGSHWDFADSYALLTAIGREAGGANADRVSTLYYVGLQLRL